MPRSLSRSHTSIGSICMGVAVKSSSPLVRPHRPGLALVPWSSSSRRLGRNCSRLRKSLRRAWWTSSTTIRSHGWASLNCSWRSRRFARWLDARRIGWASQGFVPLGAFELSGEHVTEAGAVVPGDVEDELFVKFLLPLDQDALGNKDQRPLHAPDRINWRTARPASTVLPSPTSSQSMNGCGNRSTMASATLTWCGQGWTVQVAMPSRWAFRRCGASRRNWKTIRSFRAASNFGGTSGSSSSGSFGLGLAEITVGR